MRFSYEVDGKVIGFYELNPMPGCNQVVISNHAWIAPAYRGQGHGDRAHKQRLDKARELGYDYIQCTVRIPNLPQEHIMNENGWDKLQMFWNKETGHWVAIYGRPL